MHELTEEALNNVSCMKLTKTCQQCNTDMFLLFIAFDNQNVQFVKVVITISQLSVVPQMVRCVLVFLCSSLNVSHCFVLI